MQMLEDTLKERGSRYGSFSEFSRIAQKLKWVMWNAHEGEGWEKLNLPQRQALEVIADKIARILNGDPNYVDNWHDIQGYARLVEVELCRDS